VRQVGKVGELEEVGNVGVDLEPEGSGGVRGESKFGKVDKIRKCLP
jgi:hypothetical protein